MKVLRSSIFRRRKCEFGSFELKPDNGWKISQSFIDFESGLLVVRVNDKNEKNWIDTGFGTRTIPSKEYKINIRTGHILTTEEWTKCFSYKTIEQISDDGKYKLVTTRIHEPERDSDGIEEELIELKTGKTISSSTSIAFIEGKRENLLESFYNQIREKERRKKELDALPTLSDYFEKELVKLAQGDVIIEYHNSESIFKLIYNNRSFELLNVHADFRNDLDWNTLIYKKINVFSTVQEFVKEFFTNKNWFLNYKPFHLDNSKSSQLLKKFVIDFFNDLRFKHDFTFEEYNRIQQWENHFYENNSIKPTEYKQFCSHCKSSVSYNPRYPKYICSECSSKKITDKNGFETVIF